MLAVFHIFNGPVNWVENQKGHCLDGFPALEREGSSLSGSEFKRKRPERVNQRGYVLPALMVFVTILLVALTSAEISWQKRMQREREEELIFRGKQYMRAVMLFQRKTGFYPTSIEALLNTNNWRFLRKRWKDPITNSEDWRWIRLGPNAPLNSSMSGGTAGFKGASFSGSGGQRQGSTFGTQTGLGSSGFNRTGSESGLSASGGFGGVSGTSSAGGSGMIMSPIIGVASKSEKDSIKTLNGQTKYNRWEFIYLPGMNITWSVGPGSPGLAGGTGGSVMPGSTPGVGPGSQPGNRPGYSGGMGQGMQNPGFGRK